MSRQQEQEQEQQEQEKIMNKLKTDILNMYKKIKLYRGGAYAPPLTPSVKGGVIGERSSRGALTPSVKGGVIGELRSPTSTSYLNHTKLREEYRTILETAYNTINNQPTNYGKRRGKWHAEVLYQLMAHTRDIVHGYGERDLAYMQLFEWARIDVPLAKHALELFVNSSNGNSNSNGNIGSWKDVKSFFAYMRRVINVRDDRDMRAYTEMTDFMVGMVNARLAADVLAFYSDVNENENDNNDDPTNSKYESVSLVSKWIPRENKSKKYGNLYERLACDYYKMWLPKDKSNNTSYDKAVLKCKIHYRKLISFFNRYLETPQIKMCEQNWANIDFDRVGRRTQKLQNAAFLNLNVDKQTNQTNQTNKTNQLNETGKNNDRETCADKYKTWKSDMLNYKRGISSNLVHHVTDIQYGLYHLESDKNAEWRAYVSQFETANTTNLKYMIPVLTGTSFRTVGLALAVAEKSVIGKRLITTTANANCKTRNNLELYNLEDSFVKNVKKMRPYNSDNKDNKDDKDKLDIYLSLIAVLQTMIDSGITPKQLKEYPQLTVVIFADRETDVRIGECETCDCMCKFNSAYNEAVRVYAEFGYAAPKILLWALKSESESELDSEHRLQYYSSGNILSRRVGCGESDIVRFLGIADTKDNTKYTKGKMQNHQIQIPTQNQHSEQKCDEYAWHKEWNSLVNQLYNSNSDSNERHINFGRYFWKCM